MTTTPPLASCSALCPTATSGTPSPPYPSPQPIPIPEQRIATGLPLDTCDRGPDPDRGSIRGLNPNPTPTRTLACDKSPIYESNSLKAQKNSQEGARLSQGFGVTGQGLGVRDRGGDRIQVSRNQLRVDS